MVNGDTTPPPLLQEADLIGLMEKHGIGESGHMYFACILHVLGMYMHVGTDATHAEHIETIKTRNYVGVQPDGGFVPGELGMGLVEGMYGFHACDGHGNGTSKKYVIWERMQVTTPWGTNSLNRIFGQSWRPI